MAQKSFFEVHEIDAIELAAREALLNAMIHGNQNDPSKHILVCCISNLNNRLVIAITDQGSGFEPERVNDPRVLDNLFSSHGRGIFLMRQLMDDVRFEAEGRGVVLTKERHPAH